MPKTLNRRLLIGLCAAALAPAALAQGSPGGPVKLLVGFPAGGSIDLAARLVSEKLAAALGTTVIVENKSGAGGRLAAAALKNAAPDGRTIMLAPSAPIVIAPHTFRKLNYDPKTDFAPVAKLVNMPLAIAVGGDSPNKTLADLTNWFKAHPDKAAFGTSAAGSQLHFLGLMYGQAIKMDLTHVAYQGGAPLITDLIGGQVPAGIDQFPLEFYKSGKIRLLATSSAQRSPLIPDVPTFKEQGVNVEGQAWIGAFVPAKTPEALVQKIGAALIDAVNQPDVKAKLAAAGMESAGTPAPEYAAELAKDNARWQKVVEVSGFRAD